MREYCRLRYSWVVGQTLGSVLWPAQVCHNLSTIYCRLFLNKIVKAQEIQNPRAISAKNSIFRFKTQQFCNKTQMSRNFYWVNNCKNFSKLQFFPPKNQGFWPQNSSYRNSRAHSSSNLCSKIKPVLELLTYDGKITTITIHNQY